MIKRTLTAEWFESLKRSLVSARLKIRPANTLRMPYISVSLKSKSEGSAITRAILQKNSTDRSEM